MKSRRSSRKSDGNSQNGIVGAIIYDKNAALISENSISSENIDNHVSLDEDTDIYIANCKKYMINPDPGVLISLKTRWNILQPTKQFNEGAMLPLLGVLEKNNHIETLKLSDTCMQSNPNSGNGNSNARVLGLILQKNNKVKEVDLCNTGLTDEGLAEICRSLQSNSAVENLNLSSNYFSYFGAATLRDALANYKHNLRKIDLSRNALGYNSIYSLQCVGCVLDGTTVLNTYGNYVFEEIWNSVTHGIAFLLSCIAAIILMSEAMETYNTDYHFWACAIFSFTLCFLFMSSTLFHSFFMLPNASHILQILDHVGIYLLIAGSYTPFLMIGLHDYPPAFVLLGAVWIAAIGGSIFSASSDLNSPTTNTIEIILFLCMGGSVVMVFPAMLEALSSGAIFLLALGGAAYIVGLVFFIMGEKRRPVYHCVWHVFVILGAGLHWFDVYFFIVNKRLGDRMEHCYDDLNSSIYLCMQDQQNNATLAGTYEMMAYCITTSGLKISEICASKLS